MMQPDKQALNDALQVLTRSPLWAIQSEALAAILAHGPAAVARQAKPTQANKIAVIPIYGVLTNDTNRYGSSYKDIGDAAEKAAAAPDVKRIVLAVDSPGGEVTGLPETAAVLARAAKLKPVSAIVEGTSASAAYWLTSQAHDITLTPSGEVGSVGVRMMHVDVSKMLSDMGYNVTELYSGDFKTEWSPYKPLSDEAKADMQPRLESVHRDFINAVAAGRSGASREIVAKRFGEGRMFSSKEARQHGLVDRIQSPANFYRGLAESLANPEIAAARARLELERHRFSA